MPLFEALDASARQLVLDHLPYDRTDAAVTNGLAAMSTSDLLIRWFNWNQRLVPARPRQVRRSREFLANPIIQQRLPEIDALIADIESGADLTKYLSRGVKHGYIDPTGIKTHLRQDLDLMLSAWGFHHLHTSETVERDGFVERDGHIVFAAFKQDVAYLIDLMTHKDWAKEHVLRVVVNNWPDDGLVYEVKGVVGLARTIDDDDRLALRKKQVNTMTEIDGKVYGHPNMMSASGIGYRAVRQADMVMDALQQFAKVYEQDPEGIRRQLLEDKPWPGEPDFVVCFQPQSFGLVERQTNKYIRLGP